MTSKYRPDRPGTGDLMRSAGVQHFLEDVAQDAKRYAESIAPRDSGEYAGSFRTEADISYAETRERRAVVRLVNDADHAGAVESKTHVLSRTRDHIESTYG